MSRIPRRRRTRPVRADGAVAYVPLTRGFEAVIDAADVGLVSGFNWQVEIKEKGTLRYAKRARRVVDGPGTGVIYLHTVISGVAAGMTDHRDGDGLNCRRSNLRPATSGQNSQNRRVHKPRSLPKGVYPAKRRFKAVIMAAGVVHNLGQFSTPELASAAYVEASKRLHGEFSRT